MRPICIALVYRPAKWKQIGIFNTASALIFLAILHLSSDHIPRAKTFFRLYMDHWGTSTRYFDRHVCESTNSTFKRHFGNT